jgi:S-layer family protein
MRAFGSRLAAAFVLSTLLAAPDAKPQSWNPTESLDRVEVPPRYTPEFGASTSILTISAQDFRVSGGTEGAFDGDTLARSCAPDLCSFLSGLSLPSGARLTSLEVEGCDYNPSGSILFSLYRAPSPVQNASLISPLGSTGEVATPGCALFSVPVDHTIDNLSGQYVILVLMAANNVKFTAVRVRYHLQVSPAPLTATFNDVPIEHPQFQFIEALVDAGVTAGCGSGNYCPNANLTRGQMAVFLAKALGLNFPN